MSKDLAHVPRITKMAKYLQTVNNNRDLTVYHLRIMAVIREMNTTVQIISGLTGIHENKVRERLNELQRWGLASITETRARDRKIWGLHDDFRSHHKVPTYPSLAQQGSLDLKRRKGGQKLDVDEMAAYLWGDTEMVSRGHSEALVDLATTLKKTPILSQQAGDVEARRQATVVTPEPMVSWDLDDFIEE